MAEHPMKLWGAGFRTLKVQLVAAFAGVPIEQNRNYTHGTSNKTAQFLALNEWGKVRNSTPHVIRVPLIAFVQFSAAAPNALACRHRAKQNTRPLRAILQHLVARKRSLRGIFAS